MTVELNFRKAEPQDWDELARDFKPVDVSERDRTVQQPGPDGRVRILQRRVREVRFVTGDQNSIKTMVWDIGPATGDDAITIPCGGATDMAQVHDAFDKHLNDWYPFYLQRRRAMQADRDKRFYEAIIREADERTKKALGLSTYGPGGFTQRST